MKSIGLALVPVLILLAIVLVGCGQKGPLFLPGQNPNPPHPLLDKPDQSHAMSQPDATRDTRMSRPATSDNTASD